MTLFEELHSERPINQALSILQSFKSREINIDGQSLQTTPVFDSYWYFATARQRIFHDRVARRNAQSLGANDPILSQYRFTNAYRASDRVSQYLIREIIEGETNQSNENIFFRIMLFKIFNKIETWEALEGEFGSLKFSNFNFLTWNEFLSDRKNSGKRNYSAAYIMPSAGGVFGHKAKHSNHLRLIEWMIEEGFHSELSNSKSMEEGYKIMLSAPSIGPFLAYQFITDLNYSNLTDYSEMEFVQAGPGAIDGISKCFDGFKRVKTSSIISYMAKYQKEYFLDLGYDFQDLWGRPLQLIDCQNIFCEISKYSRVAFPKAEGVAGRTRIKQKYKQSRTPVPVPNYPEKWNLRLQKSSEPIVRRRNKTPQMKKQASFL